MQNLEDLVSQAGKKQTEPGNQGKELVTIVTCKRRKAKVTASRKKRTARGGGGTRPQIQKRGRMFA